jgi:thiamine-monophosphate kinase
VSSEFDLIARFFKRPVPAGMLGGGDDCALLRLTPGLELATSKDLLIQGRHFFADVDPYTLGHKALAVNLSDLAAMGAKPIACMLGLALPAIDEHWLARFADGFYALADLHGCALIGGDTTRSPEGVTISVTVFGEVDPIHAMRRNGAQVGDDIWVSGRLGAADVAYRILAGEVTGNPAPRLGGVPEAGDEADLQQPLGLFGLDGTLLEQTRAALEKPIPRVFLGQRLSTHAHAAIDISDGLLQDLGHILKASAVGARILEASLPAHPALQYLAPMDRRRAVLAGGDVYELCLTASPSQRDTFERIALEAGVELTKIGEIIADPTLSVYDQAGQLIAPLPLGFDHFRS